MSQDYQTRQSHTGEGNLSGPIRTSINSHTHTGNTRQPEPQLKCSSCSSVIPSHNSRDANLSHNSRNATCLTLISSQNSRDTFWPTTQGTPASQPSGYHQSLVDHAYPKQRKHNFCICNIASCCSWAAKWDMLLDRLAGETCRQAPSALKPTDLQKSTSRTTLTARRHSLPEPTICSYHLADQTLPPGATPVLT